MGWAWVTASGIGDRPDRALAVGVGVLIGLITGVIFVLLLLQVASSAKTARAKRISATVTQCFGLPAFWFGGPWLTGKLIANSGLGAAVNVYAVSLAITFLVVIGLPLIRLVLRVAERLKEV